MGIVIQGSVLPDMTDSEKSAWLQIGEGVHQVVLSEEQIRKLLALNDEALSDLKKAVCAHESIDERTRDIVTLARRQWRRDGEIEIDDNCVVSEGSDNGAYIQAWVWVEFSDTPLDKEAMDPHSRDA